ncbi:hypothetical protein C8R45DRAFT_200227 [Mycena sanguinolenta]|nr:hypothetical protein C8R45DRAFT_200227 [Mycena sanguinolenta]
MHDIRRFSWRRARCGQAHEHRGSGEGRRRSRKLSGTSPSSHCRVIIPPQMSTRPVYLGEWPTYARVAADEQFSAPAAISGMDSPPPSPRAPTPSSSRARGTLAHNRSQPALQHSPLKLELTDDGDPPENEAAVLRRADTDTAGQPDVLIANVGISKRVSPIANTPLSPTRPSRQHAPLRIPRPLALSLIVLFEAVPLSSSCPSPAR